MSGSQPIESGARRSRREFLAASGLIAGAGVAGSLAVGRACHAAGSDALRIGLIGCGGRGAGAVRSALTVEPGARLVAMADAFRDRMESCRNSLKKAVGDGIAVDDDHLFDGFEGYRRLLASGVDVAILAEPPHFRPMHIEGCVEAGVHLMAEKPMAVDAPGARRVLAAGEKAKEKNLSFVSGFESRYSTPLREAVQRVHDGAIGEIVAIHGTYNTGFLWHRGRQPDWSEMQYQMRNWYYFTWLSGDHIVEQYVHLIDRACWIMKEESPAWAWGYGGRQVRTEPKWGDIFDHHAVVYQYQSGPRMFAFTRQQANCFREVAGLVLGTQGKLAIEHRPGIRILDLHGEEKWAAEKETRHAEHTCFEEMFAGIRRGEPINDGFTMGHSTMVAIMGRMATHSGQQIPWDKAFNSTRVLAPKSYAWDADPPVLPGPDGHYPEPIPGVTEVL
jgi:predicted dehydrogenase